MSRVDVVIVSYGSKATLRACVEPLAGLPGLRVIVVDNDSPDDALGTIADLPVHVIRAGRNGGFSFGCNLGAAAGSSEYVLFLNPDAVMREADVAVLVDALDENPALAIVGPRILGGDGELLFTRRRRPRLSSTYGQALFLHRIFPRASWLDEMITDPAAYEHAAATDWLSGACLLVRRDAFEAIGGFDEDYFLYCEDTDLCVRLHAAGGDVRYIPDAVARHIEGSSAPRSELLVIHARSRVRYAHVHEHRAVAALDTAGAMLSAATHALVAWPRRRPTARGHLAVLRELATPKRVAEKA